MDAEEFGKEMGCSACGGDLKPLGQLGSLMHFRCRQCGMNSQACARCVWAYPENCLNHGGPQ
jgi:hypothetical protein